MKTKAKPLFGKIWIIGTLLFMSMISWMLYDILQRYWCSQNLKRPETTINGVEEFGLGKIVRNSKPDYINDNYEIQYHASRGSKINSKELMLDLPF